MARACCRGCRLRFMLPAIIILASLAFYYVHNIQQTDDSDLSDAERDAERDVERLVGQQDIEQDVEQGEDAHARDIAERSQKIQAMLKKLRDENKGTGNKKDSKDKEPVKGGGKMRQDGKKVESKQLSGKIAGIAPKKSKSKGLPNAPAKAKVNLKAPPVKKTNVKTLQQQRIAQRAINYMASKDRSDPELACKMPELKPYDDSINHLIANPEPLKCEGAALTYLMGNRLFINKTVARGTKYSQCYYSYMERYDDDITRVTDPHKAQVVKQNTQLNFKVSSDFSVIGCQKGTRSSKAKVDLFDEDDPAMHVDLHAHIVEKPDVIDTGLRRLRQNKGDSLGLNIIMLGIDSTSRLNFLRQMPKSYRALYGMGAVTLTGYNIVGDATTGALIPLLTGRHEHELPTVRRDKHDGKYVDASYNFIWDVLGLNGYVTMFAEDEPKISTFNLRLNGFERQPTDHYMRTFWQEVQVKGHCLGPKPVHQVMLDYTTEFMKSYPRLPKFGLSFFTGLTHSDINKIKLMDNDLSAFLESSRKSGAFNNTMFVLFSDHGSRYTAIRSTMQGKLEERLPYMSILLPKWVKDKRPLLYANLMKNYNRLTTPFDIHETLRSVVDHKPYQLTSKQKGISLFNEIPKSRTCITAGVDLHWCSCLEWMPVPFTNLTGLAKSFVGSMNELLKMNKEVCVDLVLLRIVKAERLVPTDELMKFIGTKTKNEKDEPEFHDEHTVDIHSIPLYYQMTVEVMPGRALFEGTLKVHPGLSDTFVMYELTSPISRINKYGFTASCVEKTAPHIAKYCFCREYVGLPVAFMGTSVKEDKVVSHSVA